MVTARREVSGAVDDVTFYLTSIARFDLLTAEEEVDLAQTMEDGRAGSERLATGERLSTGERVTSHNPVRAGE